MELRIYGKNLAAEKTGGSSSAYIGFWSLIPRTLWRVSGLVFWLTVTLVLLFRQSSSAPVESHRLADACAKKPRSNAAYSGKADVLLAYSGVEVGGATLLPTTVGLRNGCPGTTRSTHCSYQVRGVHATQNQGLQFLLIQSVRKTCFFHSFPPEGLPILTLCSVRVVLPVSIV